MLLFPSTAETSMHILSWSSCP